MNTATVHFGGDSFAVQVSCGASVKRQKKTRSRIEGSPKGKPLSVRYAELLKLRRAVMLALSEKERTPSSPRRSN
jgi:hypothetical protein